MIKSQRIVSPPAFHKERSKKEVNGGRLLEGKERGCRKQRQWEQHQAQS